MSLAHSRRFRDNFSPGLGTVLFDILPKTLKPVATVFIGFRLLEASGQEIPPLIAEYVRRYPVLSLLLASSGLGVLTSFVRGVYRLIVTRRERLALGAEYPTWARSTSVLGLDFVRKIQYKWDHGYLGEGFGWLLEENNATTVGFTMFGEETIITKDPWFIKSSLATDFDSFEKGDLTHAAFRTVLGSGIFSVDGDLWKFHRSMARPFFARHQLAELDSIDRHTLDVVSQIKQAHKLGKALDFQELILRFTLDTATEFFLGSCVHSLKTPVPVSGSSIKESAVTIFSDAFAGAQNKMLHRLQAGPHWVWTELFEDKTKHDTQIINNFIEPILKTALARKRARKHSDASHKSTHSQTMLDHLVDQTDDIVIIRDQLMSVMIAGRDTTAATIAFVVYQLSQHPDVLAKLRQEVLSVLGPEAQPSLESIKEMKYMKAVTQETLRLYPPLPFNFRISNRNTTVTDPETGKKLFIAKGTTIFHAFYAMHIRKDLWGDDAEVFDPDRWIDDRKERVLKNPFMWLPFQAGPRICLGQQFAMNEIAFFMARLLQTIDRIELCPEEWPEGTLAPEEWKNGTDRRRLEVIRPKSNLTIFIDGGLWVKMYPAAQSSETTSTRSGTSA